MMMFCLDLSLVAYLGRDLVAGLTSCLTRPARTPPVKSLAVLRIAVVISGPESRLQISSRLLSKSVEKKIKNPHGILEII